MKAAIAVIAIMVIIGVIWYALESANTPTNTIATSPTADGSVISPTDTMMYTTPYPTGMMSVTTTPEMTGSPSPARAVSIKLGEQNDSGETGTAMLTETNGKVTVRITMTGAPAGVDQPAHIHTGACPGVGDVKYPLTNLKNGQSTTTLNTTLSQLQTQLPLGINVHKSTTDTKTYVACGDLDI